MTASPGTDVRRPTDFADRLGHAIALGEDADTVLASLATALQRIRVRIEPTGAGQHRHLEPGEAPPSDPPPRRQSVPVAGA